MVTRAVNVSSHQRISTHAHHGALAAGPHFPSNIDVSLGERLAYYWGASRKLFTGPADTPGTETNPANT